VVLEVPGRVGVAPIAAASSSITCVRRGRPHRCGIVITSGGIVSAITVTAVVVALKVRIIIGFMIASPRQEGEARIERRVHGCHPLQFEMDLDEKGRLGPARTLADVK
jgi:hypothetical protein